MRHILLLMFAAVLLPAPDSVHEFTMNSIEGTQAPLAQFKGKTVLFVNVASQCGYTPQYKGLEALYRKYKDNGFVVVGVPANNFGAQEPGTNQEIQTFCKRNFDVSFPMMAKVSVKGDDITPLYRHLVSQTGRDIQWNFTKILVDKQGKVLQRFEPNVDPEASELVTAVERALRE
ncbi:MAG: glutathione peroxidase [Acidobacteriota bacterium]